MISPSTTLLRRLKKADDLIVQEQHPLLASGFLPGSDSGLKNDHGLDPERVDSSFRLITPNQMPTNKKERTKT